MMHRIGFILPLAGAFFLLLDEASVVPACCPAPPRGKPVVNADQTVIIIWDADTKTEGFTERDARVRARRRVPSTRDRRIAARRRALHRAAIVSPARWTTASSPSSLAASIVPVRGSHATSSSALASCRTRRSTTSPRERQDEVNADPTSPVLPLSATRKFLMSLDIS